MAIKQKSYKESFKNYIMSAAKLLAEKAEDIVDDIDTSKVQKISISLELYPHEAPELEISKTYYPVDD